MVYTFESVNEKLDLSYVFISVPMVLLTLLYKVVNRSLKSFCVTIQMKSSRAVLPCGSVCFPKSYTLEI